MIRLAFTLFIFVLATHSVLPSICTWITRPVHEHCLKSTPLSDRADVRNIQESLVCGRNLKDQKDEFLSWRELGMIHVLVVSGGHLSVLAIFVRFALMLLIRAALSCLPSTSLPITDRQLRIVVHVGTLIALTWLAMANRFEPPILRAWLDYLIRPSLKRHGYQDQEAGLVATWLSLPAIDTASDALSLGLSFFASVLVEVVGGWMHRRPWLAAFTLQAVLWWTLLPLLLPLGLPHPLATLSNLLLAPLIGGVLIPLALVHHGISQLNFTWLQTPFAWAWELTHELVALLGRYAPDLAPRLALTDSQRLLASLSLTMLALALTLRRIPNGRIEQTLASTALPLGLSAVLLTSGSLLHHSLKNNGSPISRKLPFPTKTASAKSPTKRGKVCIPYRAIERPARNRYCRRKH